MTSCLGHTERWPLCKDQDASYQGYKIVLKLTEKVDLATSLATLGVATYRNNEMLSQHQNGCVLINSSASGVLKLANRVIHHRISVLTAFATRGVATCKHTSTFEY